MFANQVMVNPVRYGEPAAKSARLVNTNGREGEALLVRRVADGDRRAFRELAERHGPALGRYIGRMLGGTADVEDIRQETLLRLWTQAERWRPEVAALSTWLHRIAHNLCIDHLRKASRLVSDDEASARFDGEVPERREPALVSGHDVAQPADPDQALGQLRLGDQLRDALACIPERQRSALILCHYQGISNRDAAEVLDVSVDALESLLARARRKLRQLLSDVML